MKITITLLACILLFCNQLNAFCIYNNLPEGAGQFWIRQQPINAGNNYFSRFARTALKPGENACCHYSTFDCNRSGKQDEVLKMTIRRTSGTIEFPSFVISLPAGGVLQLGGGYDHVEATIDIFNPDGTPYDYEYKIDHQAGYT